jgi:hypothetical protein
MIIVRIILGIALLGALVCAGRSVYRRLPLENSNTPTAGAIDGSSTQPLIVVLSSGLANATLNSPVELYPFDLVATQKAFQTTPHTAKQFDEFLARRMQGVTPLKALTDSKGRAVALLNDGNWWVRATAEFADGVRIEWRLPIAVSGREQTVELTSENAYERTKKF